MSFRDLPIGRQAAAVLVVAACVAAAPHAWAEPVPVRLDQEATVGGVDVACTGIGETKALPKWSAYSVRLEFAEASGAYLSGEEVTVAGTKDATPLLDVTCEGPWVLLKLPPGKPFKVEARLQQAGPAPKTATVKAPSQGQATFVIAFPDAH